MHLLFLPHWQTIHFHMSNIIQSYGHWLCKLLVPIMRFTVRRKPQVAVVITTGAKEEVR